MAKKIMASKKKVSFLGYDAYASESHHEGFVEIINYISGKYEIFSNGIFLRTKSLCSTT
jgi:hypothetical protein